MVKESGNTEIAREVPVKKRKKTNSRERTASVSDIKNFFQTQMAEGNSKNKYNLKPRIPKDKDKETSKSRNNSTAENVIKENSPETVEQTSQENKGTQIFKS